MLPRTAIRILRVSIALTVIGYGSGNKIQAQVFDFEHSSPQSLSLDGRVRFHLGDDPDGKLGWAATMFDDSQWTLLRSDLPWSEQGYWGYGGFAWYRFQVVMPTHPEALGILFPRVRTSYEIFADGKSVGQFGGMPPHGRFVIG